MTDDVRFFIDENLPDTISGGLSRLGVKAEFVTRGNKDPEIIAGIGVHGQRGVWITGDKRARREHREAILRCGISVAWIVGQNMDAFKSTYLAFTFVYRYRGVLEKSGVPLYYEVSEYVAKGLPRVKVRRIGL